MAMTFVFRVHPFGSQNKPIEFGQMSVHSAGDLHKYHVRYKNVEGWQSVRGAIVKDKSGHRNFLHLLGDILDDMDLDALGVDYVNIMEEVAEDYPDILRGRRVRDYVEEQKKHDEEE